MAEKFYGQALGNSSAVRWLVIHYYWVFIPKTLYTWSSFAAKLSRVYVLRTLEQTKHIFFFFELLFEKARLLRFALNVVFVVAFFPKILRPRSNLISGLFWFNLSWFLAPAQTLIFLWAKPNSNKVDPDFRPAVLIQTPILILAELNSKG